MASYCVQSFGCRASAADGDGIAWALEREGGLAPSSRDEASVVILNTCAVTEEAERDARAAVRRVRRKNPEARIIVTGCYAQRAPQELAALAGVSAVVGNSHKGLVARAALTALGPPATPQSQAGWVPASELTGGPGILHAPFGAGQIAGEHANSFALPLAGVTARTRPVLKVQEGCSNRCAFCVIPETRGPSRSVSLKAALAAAREHTAEGVQELVLSGINLGRWGRDLNPAQSLPELVAALLGQIPLPRLRLSSIEPMDWTDALLALFAQYGQGEHPRLAPHAHLPLQSGSDTILRRMHRRYRPWHYAEKLAAVRKLLPEAAIGADVMVGFPGETDALFRESVEFLASQPVTYLHLFPYSPRPGTAAAAWHAAAPVTREAVRERMETLAALGREKHRKFAAGFMGRTLSAVSLKDGTALTANFLPVRLRESVAPNRLLRVRIASMERDVLAGAEYPGSACGAGSEEQAFSRVLC